ncbi:hypothetical protein [Paenibacillus rigui]|uniref:Thiamine phosphate synthase/TenI domain-containing protein n=1 Tax=Paenibacillus rigui TaxID=554312 RepID=A0A229ULV0_9BACL|nr:hypothetical protein [Paenibacillus rigui]OXM84353.1 hypothetical protein CF651_21475 [Paenibacillus rigui]
MNRLRQALHEPKLQLFVSLPSNDLNLAKAALQEGAEGLKVHINVDHRASGNSFGPLSEYTDTFREIRSLFNGPLGIVPGGALESVNPHEIEQLSELDIDFYSIYAWHMPAFLLQAKLASTFAIDSQFDTRLLEAAKAFPIEALEASIIPSSEYGTPLNFADLLRYRWLAHNAHLPVIVPSQRKLAAADVPALKDSGIKALLLGAVVTGKSADEIKRAVHDFRNAIDS